MLPRTPRSLAAALAAALLVTGSTAPVSAYCQATTCNDCKQPRYGCVTDGQRLQWNSDCVSYNLQKAASVQVPFAVATEVVDRAFSHWTSVSCPASGRPPTITTKNRGPVVCDQVEYNNPYSNPAKQSAADAEVTEPRLGGNANIIMFRDTEWNRTKASDPNSTIALTTVTFAQATGEILDADIEVNGTLPLSTTDVPAVSSYDLESILTHEAGHFLGLAHSDKACSGTDCPTMTAEYTTGLTHYRTLEADDVHGICSIYGQDREIVSSACTPMYGFSSECGLPLPAESGCALRPSGATGGRSNLQLATCLVALGAVGVRQRQRSRRRPTAGT